MPSMPLAKDTVMTDTDEQVIIVDEHNQITGVLPRSQMRSEKLCHRATYVFVFNSNGQIYVQERTLNKDIYPGFFEPATGGVVTEGESYDTAAARELTEELGVENVELSAHFHFYFDNEDCKVWGRVYSCLYDGKITPQEEEVADVILQTPEEILSNRHHRHYTPDSLVALKRLLQSRQINSFG